MSEPRSRWARFARSVWVFAGLLAIAASGGDGLALQRDAPRTGRNSNDANGDPLPAGARGRLGTLRWRHGQAVNYVAFLPDGKAVLTGSQDRILRLWDRDTGKEIRQIQRLKQNPPGGLMVLGGGYGAAAPAFSPDGKLLATAEAVLVDKKVATFDVN